METNKDLLNGCNIGDKVNLYYNNGAEVLKNNILTGVLIDNGVTNICLNNSLGFTIDKDQKYYRLELVSPKLDIIKISQDFNIYSSIVEKYKHTKILELAENFYMINSLNLNYEKNNTVPAIHINVSYVLVGPKSMVEVMLPFGPITNFNFNKNEEDSENFMGMSHPLKHLVFDRGWTQTGFDENIRPHLEKMDFINMVEEMKKYL